MLEMALLGNRLLVSISSMTHLDIMHGTSDFNYCPNCGVTAVYSGENGQRILSCECGYVHYKDPKVAVGVLDTCGKRRGLKTTKLMVRATSCSRPLLRCKAAMAGRQARTCGVPWNSV